MNTPTPPGRKVAKPKSRQMRRPIAPAPTTDLAGAASASEAEKTGISVEPSPSTAPTAPSSAPQAPTFIDSESTVEKPRRPKKHASRGKWHDKPQAPAADTPPPTPKETVETGPQTRHLTLLGNKTIYSDRYTPAILEAFENRHPENDYFVKFNCPEFTSLCPITGQPDFATIYISYIPDRKMVESKSLKLYLFGFRNHGAFHEDCVNIIMKDLIKLMSPRYIEVWGKFLPRGGLSIDPFANYGRPTTRWEEFARQRLLMHDLTPERVDNR